MTTCDKIESKKQICFFGKFDVPVWLCVEKFYEYHMVPHTLALQEAIDIAFSDLRVLLDELMTRAELVAKDVSVSCVDDSVRIYCRLYCLENIAKEQKIEISQQ